MVNGSERCPFSCPCGSIALVESSCDSRHRGLAPEEWSPRLLQRLLLSRSFSSVAPPCFKSLEAPIDPPALPPLPCETFLKQLLPRLTPIRQVEVDKRPAISVSALRFYPDFFVDNEGFEA